MTSHHGCCRCQCKQLGIAWSLLRVVVGAYDSEALKVVRECRRGSSGDLGARRSFRWAWEAWEETSYTITSTSVKEDDITLPPPPPPPPPPHRDKGAYQCKPEDDATKAAETLPAQTQSSVLPTTTMTATRAADIPPPQPPTTTTPGLRRNNNNRGDDGRYTTTMTTTQTAVRLSYG
ncbi:hypothetical protein EDB89DRAFT_2200467 [Lactarius sanguifluus]|nr:hypothetical protein EDB89DRAFT_2200467 [Lactarius sanguifluus]